MLVSLKWLRDYVDLPADLDVDDLAHRLTMASAEVEGVHRVGAWDRALVRVGRVLAVEPHPDADRLRLATVEDGHDAPLRVVCGALNVAAGQRVAFAREGATLIDGHTGKPAKLKAGNIRGIVSSGMVLSRKELGLSEDHEGILVLPEDAPVGTPLADYLGDTVLDVHVWPNRADTMNMVGVAREVAAILGVGRSHEVAAGLGLPDFIATAIVTRVPASTGLFGIPTVHEPDESYIEGGALASDAVTIRVEDPALCARYVATVIEGVTVGPSPEWMQERLRAAGMRPISNVVDITNYVMLELGQPLHAFDLDKVRADASGVKSVRVRVARPGEVLRTLDGIERVLTPEMLCITDDSGPIGLAGVMGGASTEMSASTTRVLLEAARFDPVSIRRTSFRLALRSEASSRFERGLSPELAAHASRRATKLFVELCGGTARAGNVDVYPAPAPPVEVTLTRARLDTLIGMPVPTAEVEAILGTLGFETLHGDAGGFPIPGMDALVERLVAGNFSDDDADDDDDEAMTPRPPAEVFRVRAPWWRTDIAIGDDVAEEVVRLAGYDRLPATGIVGAIPEWEPSELLDLREELRDALASAGLQEVITYSLTTNEVLARVIAPEDLAILRPLRLRNTLSADREVLRPTLRHAILESVERAIRAGAPSIAIFEAARAFLPNHDGTLPEEREQIAGALTGVEVDRWGRAGERRLDFYDAKGALDTALAAIGVAVSYTPVAAYGFLPGHVARLLISPPSPSKGEGRGGGASGGGAPGEPVEVGILGEVHPRTLAAFDIGQPVVLFEVDLPRLRAALPARATAHGVPRFPAVEQDLALVVDEAVPAGAIRAMIEGSPLVSAATVFDVFRGGSVRAGKKSVALSIRYQAPNRTLTSEDANKEQAKLLVRLAREFGAELRG